MVHEINPEILAHNIATAFCQREINKMSDENFEPGDLYFSAPAVKKMYDLYSNVYDFAFDAALNGNKSSMDEE